MFRPFIVLLCLGWTTTHLAEGKVSKGAFALVDFSNATVTDDGSRECVNTTGMMEIYEKTPVYECVHKNEEQCHYTYVTQFEPTRQQECEENYEKSCQVQYLKYAIYHPAIGASRLYERHGHNFVGL